MKRLALVLSLALPLAARAHAGKLDRCGCHNDPAGVGPHCHKLTRLPGCPGYEPPKKGRAKKIKKPAGGPKGAPGSSPDAAGGS